MATTSVDMDDKAADTLMKTPEFEPPQSSVARIIKAALPSDVQLSKDAKASTPLEELSEASYPFLQETDWTSDVYAKLPTAQPLQVLQEIAKMIVTRPRWTALRCRRVLTLRIWAAYVAVCYS